MGSSLESESKLSVLWSNSRNSRRSNRKKINLHIQELARSKQRRESDTTNLVFLVQRNKYQFNLGCYYLPNADHFRSLFLYCIGSLLPVGVPTWVFSLEGPLSILLMWKRYLLSRISMYVEKTHEVLHSQMPLISKSIQVKTKTVYLGMLFPFWGMSISLRGRRLNDLLETSHQSVRTPRAA